MMSFSNIGRIFYGMSIAVMGLLTMYYKVFPYMLLPPQYLTPGNEMITYISGALLVLAGTFIVLQKQTRLVSFLLGIVLLLIFCILFYSIYVFGQRELQAFDGMGERRKRTGISRRCIDNCRLFFSKE